MRDSAKFVRSWLWVLAFLALPNCVFRVQGIVPNVDPGPPPLSSAVFCDVQDKNAGPPHCASASEQAMGIPLTQAAIALARNQTSDIGLDFSPMATQGLGCDAGVPVAIKFRCPFPEGCPQCLNCGSVMPSPYPDVATACIDVCLDKFGEKPPTPEVQAFCNAQRAHPSTNAAEGCFANACAPDTGISLPDFADPRRVPEPVVWANLVGVAAGGPDANTLTRTLAAGPDAGASSVQTIGRADGYVEFTVGELGTIRALGLSTGPDDADPSINDIGFGVRLSAQNNVGIFESGNRVPNGVNPDWGPFQAGDRVRISMKDRFDGSADITYTLIPAACVGPACAGTPFGPAPPHTGAYPFRVDAFIRDQNATLTDVRIVRIK